jgi:hypothetical protein
MNLAEAHQHAEHLVRSRLMTPGTEDWRGWVLHVTDEFGGEIFAVPFSTVLGKLH